MSVSPVPRRINWLMAAFETVRAIPPYRWVACGDHKWLDTFVCVVRARPRTHNTHKRVQKDSLRRSRNMYGGIAPHCLKRHAQWCVAYSMWIDPTQGQSTSAFVTHG